MGGTLLTDTLALVTLAVVIQTVGDESAGQWAWLWPLLLLAGLVVIALLTVPRLAEHLFARTNVSRAEKALFVLAVLLVLASLAEGIGTEPILGAFLAGLCLNRPLHHRQELHEHLGFVGQMIFIPFFFVDTGMRIDLSVFTEQAWVWVLAITIIGIVCAGKGAAAWLIGWIYGYSRLDRTLMIGLTIPQAAATLAVTVTASEAGAFDDTVVDAVVLTILVTCLVGPLIARYAGRQLARDKDSAAASPGEEPKKELI